jgi:hypothetical protein
MNATASLNDLIDQCKKNCNICYYCNKQDDCIRHRKFSTASNKIRSNFYESCRNEIESEFLDGHSANYGIPFTFVSSPIIGISQCDEYEEKRID